VIFSFFIGCDIFAIITNIVLAISLLYIGFVHCVPDPGRHFYYRKSFGMISIRTWLRIPLLTAFLTLSFLVISENQSAFASQNPELDRAQLMEIARQFVDRVGNKIGDMKENPAEASGPVTAETIEKAALTQIPDGESLLLIPRYDSFQAPFDVRAIKNKGEIFYSFQDIVESLELAIDYSDVKQTGRGWFLREDWIINANFKDRTVISRGESYKIDDNDYLIQEDVVYISTSAIERWMDMKFTPALAEQNIRIASKFPPAFVARMAREKSNKATRYTNIAQLPRMKVKEEWFDINTADISARSRYRRTRTGDSDTSNSGSIVLEGQALKHNAFATIAGDNEDRISSVTARLSKQSEDPVLLGPFKARSYVVGDTTPTDIPQTGSTSQELGFRMSNNPLINSDFTTTDVSGDAIPGWDVELYRNGVLLDNLNVGGDGRYDFREVQLFPGDNRFEVFFYGPQGEIRTDAINIPVTAELLATQKNTYEVSLSFADTRTFQAAEVTDIDKNSPHIAFRYNTLVGDTLVYAGLRNRDLQGLNRTHVGTGFTKILGSTLLSGSLGVDDELNAGGALDLSRSIFDWRVAGSLFTQTNDFSPDSGVDGLGFTGVSGSLNKTFKPLIGDSANLALTGRYQETNDGAQQTTGNVGLSNQFGTTNISNTVTYQKNTQGGAEAESERIDDTLSVRTRYGDLSNRTGVSLQIKPEKEINQYFSQFTYNHSNDLTTDLTLNRQPLQDFNEARLAVNYNQGKVRFSPFLQANTDKEYQAGINMNLTAVDRPGSSLPMVTSRRLIGSGYVSSFVYHDKNGNRIYDGNDVPLPDVIVESLNIKRRQLTDSKGYSLLMGMANTVPTDIAVDASTLPDPYMISGFGGVSVLPVAGEILELEFPIHLSSTMDGTVTVRDPDIQSPSYASAEVKLLPIDGSLNKPVTTKSFGDGYFEMQLIAPGRYLQVISSKSASLLNAGGFVPRIIQINYEGNDLPGQDIELIRRVPNVPVSIQKVQSGVPLNQPIYSMKVRRGGNSPILALLRQMASARASGDLFSDLETLETKGEKENLVSYYKLPSNDLQDSYKRCEAMQAQAISCELVVLVRDASPKKPKLKSIKTASR
jgi:hypothetical protein